MRNRKTASSLALLLLAALALASCGETSKKLPDETKDAAGETTAAATEEPTEEDLRAAIPDNLPETDMQGYQFRIWTRDRSDFVEDIGVDMEQTGEVVDDAIFNRNKVVEERFNCELVQRSVNSSSFNAELTKTITSGEDAMDVALGQVVTVPNLCIEGYFLDWYEDLPYVNLQQPWYIGNAAEALSVNGHAYAMIGEMNLDVLRFTYCMYWNQKIASDFDLENIYTVVEEGRWTYEYLRTLATQVYRDLNGDGQKSEADLLCLSGDPYSAVVTYQYAFNNPLFTIGKDGIPALTFDSEKANDIVTKLNDLYWNTAGAYTKDWGTGAEAWTNGNLLCITNLFQNAEGYRDLEFDFGIIPYPKYDEAQTSYYTMSDGAHGVMTVPITISKPDYTSIILEAMNAETYKQVAPAYYDIALKVKYSRDNESSRILDLLMESRVFDFGYIYNNGLAFVVQELVSKKSNNSQSRYTSMMKSSEKSFKKIIDAYLDLE